VPLGFDLCRFHQNREQKREKLRKAFRLENDEIAIGVIGRLVPVKNHAMFLEAMEQVANKTRKKLRVFIVGDGEMMGSLQALAQKLNLDYTVGNPPGRQALLTFTSWMKNVDEVNAAMDIIALTSLNEGTPVSLIEAQAAGKPIVSTQVGGIEDFVKHGESGYLSPSGELLPFVKNLSQLVEDDELRERMSAYSVNTVLEQFSYQRLVSDVHALYRELLAQPAAALSLANH
jgi:glycosyltransferase involved in cell wall biosynthesis